MGIELGIRQALGEKSLWIDETGPDAPAIIGSAGDAKVRLASSRVPQRVAALFAIDGAWGIEPLDAAIQVMVNGKVIQETTALRAGDVIELGSLATMTVVSVDRADRSSATAKTTAKTTTSSPGVGEWAALNAQRVAAGEGSSNRSRMRTKPKKPAGVPIGVLIVLCIAGLGVLGIMLDRVQRGRFFWEMARQPEPAVATKAPEQTPVPGRPTPEGNQRASIFDDANTANESSTKTNPIASPGHGPSIGKGEAQDAREATDGRDATKESARTKEDAVDVGEGEPADEKSEERDPDFARMIDLQRFGAPPMRVYQFQEFLRQRPDHPRAIEVRAWRDDALDLLWWMRIREFSDRREVINKRIADHTREYNPVVLANLPESRRAEIKGQLAEMIAERDGISKELLERFNWGETAAPDPLEEEQVAPMRAGRHAMKYDAFVQKILRTVNQTQGRLAW